MLIFILKPCLAGGGFEPLTFGFLPSFRVNPRRSYIQDKHVDSGLMEQMDIPSHILVWTRILSSRTVLPQALFCAYASS